MIEGLVGPDGFVAVAVADHETGIGIDKTQSILVGGVGRLHALQGFLRIIGGIGDEGGMIIPENTEIFAAKLSDEVERAARIAAARIGPGGQQRRGNVALLTGAALREIGARGSEPLCLDRLDAKGEVREAIVRIMHDQTIGEAESILHIAVRDRRDEGALDQIWIARIEPQRFAKESRRGNRIVLGARDKRREIIAGWAFANLERCRNDQVLPRPGLRAR